MTKRLLIAGSMALAGFVALAGPCTAQAQSNDKVLMIFGNDPCPAGTICIKRGESERYRIPKDLRQAAPSADNERWADRARSIQDVGATGTGSCSATGAGGWTGCWAKQMREAKATRAAVTESANAPQ